MTHTTSLKTDGLMRSCKEKRFSGISVGKIIRHIATLEDKDAALKKAEEIVKASSTETEAVQKILGL